MTYCSLLLIVTSRSNTVCFRIKKGSAYHWDLFVVGVLNIFLSIFGFPMVHGALPHSPLLVRAMADVEDRVDGGVVTQVYVTVLGAIQWAK